MSILDLNPNNESEQTVNENNDIPNRIKNTKIKFLVRNDWVIYYKLHVYY